MSVQAFGAEQIFLPVVKGYIRKTRRAAHLTDRCAARRLLQHERDLRLPNFDAFIEFSSSSATGIISGGAKLDLVKIAKAGLPKIGATSGSYGSRGSR
ncbi:hypothetical protein FHX15_005905 [Rhizobium sp. BK650]|uniref:hypothetical protein n=1 Tax=Rhizobium sp. BK650 TaxID=2586990 RepID=UPI00160B8BE8|nr:hypothetical protein [Rhizobium sp. BK650]MBB3660634.1 hypothetical protein [Rhizobium sp. BK650]